MIDVRCGCGAVYHAHEDYIGKSLQCTNPTCRAIIKIERPVQGPRPLSRQSSSPVPEIVVDAPVVPARIPSDRISHDGRVLIAFGIGLVGILLCVALWTYHVPQETDHNPAVAPSSSEAPTLPPCAIGQNVERPPSGARIRRGSRTKGLGQLRIINGTEHDAAIRLVDAQIPKTIRFVYVRANDAYTIDGIARGTYVLLFSSGNDWVKACTGFLQGSGYQEFDKRLEFEESETKYSEFEVTLHPVPEGTAKTTPVDAKRFLEGDEGPSAEP